MTDTVARPDVDAIEARAEAATEGVWSNGHSKIPGTGWCHWFGPISEPSQSFMTPMFGQNAANDARFCGYARTDIPALIAYIRHLESKGD